jgi:hypothetical protein
MAVKGMIMLLVLCMAFFGMCSKQPAERRLTEVAEEGAQKDRTSHKRSNKR